MSLVTSGSIGTAERAWRFSGALAVADAMMDRR